MNKKILILIALIILIFAFSLVQASETSISDYKEIRSKSIDFTNINLLEKNVNDVILIDFFDKHILDCEVKRMNDMYDIRQIRCAPPCWPVENFSENCIPVTGESYYFVFSINLENHHVISGSIDIEDKNYRVKTFLNSKEIFPRDHSDLSQGTYSYVLSENLRIVGYKNPPIIIDSVKKQKSNFFQNIIIWFKKIFNRN